MAIADYYNNTTLEILERSWTKDSMGGDVQGTSSRGSGISCRIEEVDGAEREHLGIERSVWTLRIFCSPAFNVHQGDLASFTYNNETLTMEVLYPDRLFQKSAFHHYELIVTEAQNQNEHVS